MSTVLREVIQLASQSRSGLPEAIGLRPFREGADVGSTGAPLPMCLQSIYSVVEGTRRDIPDQSVMDIVPGYRLVHINELDDTTRPFHAAWPELARFVPFLADYGANYYLVGSSDETVGHLDRVEGFAKVACSLDAF